MRTANAVKVDWGMVRLYARSAGLSFSSLAESSGYTRQYLYEMERTGRCGPAAVAKLAQALGVPEICIISEKGEE